jgi:hypothetical protein
MVADLNFLNLFDQDTVTGVFTAISTPQSVITGPTFGFPNNGAAFVNALNSGALLNQINTHLNGTPTVLNRKDSRYRQPNNFQAPRTVRFGFRLLF